MVVIWGVNFSVVKAAFDVIDPLAFNALRFVLASGLMLVVLAMQGELRLPERGDVPRLVKLALVGNILYQLAFILGVARTGAGIAAVILALVPVFVLLHGLFNGEAVGGRAWIGAIASLVGVAFVSGGALFRGQTRALAGDLILVAAAVLWTYYTVAAKPLIARNGSIQITAWTLWIGAPGIVLIGVPGLARQPWGDVGLNAWLGILYSGLLSIGLAYLIWYRGVERLGDARTAIFSNLTPVVGLIAGALLLGERLTIYSAFGAALVIGGVMLVRGPETA